jgi:hypothetical protein
LVVVVHTLLCVQVVFLMYSIYRASLFLNIYIWYVKKEKRKKKKKFFVIGETRRDCGCFLIYILNSLI